MINRTRRRGLLAATLGVAVAVTVAACGSVGGGSSSAAGGGGKPMSTAVPTAPVSISETGSTLLYPLFNAWDPAYHKAHPNITITAQGTGSGTGISQASAGAADIGASDAYLSPGQKKTPGMRNIPLAISAQQINYNLPGVSGHVKLNGSVLSGIYQGKITHWNDPAITKLNPGMKLPNIKTVPLHRSDGSGDTFLFTQYLSKADQNGWGNKVGFGTTVSFPAVPGALGEHGNGGMVSGCKATPGCIAYVGISYLDQTTKAGLGEAKLANAAGRYELPTAQTIQAEAKSFTGKTPQDEAVSLIYGNAADGYPIINYEYAIINSQKLSGAKAQAVRAFLSWAVSADGGNATKFVNPVHFQPLPTSVVKLSQAQIDRIGNGS